MSHSFASLQSVWLHLTPSKRHEIIAGTRCPRSKTIEQWEELLIEAIDGSYRALQEIFSYAGSLDEWAHTDTRRSWKSLSETKRIEFIANLPCPRGFSNEVWNLLVLRACEGDMGAYNALVELSHPNTSCVNVIEKIAKSLWENLALEDAREQTPPLASDAVWEEVFNTLVTTPKFLESEYTRTERVLKFFATAVLRRASFTPETLAIYVVHGIAFMQTNPYRAFKYALWAAFGVELGNEPVFRQDQVATWLLKKWESRGIQSHSWRHGDRVCSIFQEQSWSIGSAQYRAHANYRKTLPW